MKNFIGKFKTKLKGTKAKALMMTLMFTFMLTSVSASASTDITAADYTASSFLTPETTQVLSNVGQSLIMSVIALIALLVPTGLTMWGIGFVIKRGLGFLKKSAQKSFGA